MKLMKIAVFALMLALLVSLVGCDVEGMMDDIIGGDKIDNTESGIQEGDGEDNHECNFVLEAKRDPTCEIAGEEKYKCSCGKTKNVPIDALGHTEEKIEAKDPTDTEPGMTEGKMCSVCGTILIKPEYIFVGDYSIPESYDGDYAYNSLLKLNKAEKLTELYNLIDEKADAFHKEAVDLTEAEQYVIAEINYSSLGLSGEEALAVWAAYKTDRPLYYWMSSNILYNDNELNIIVDEEYAKASVRASINAKIYAGVQSFVEEAYTDSIYNTALGFHDLIILAIDYAYEADGVTPEDDVWAHNVTGVFDKGAGVCEAYAKTFQLLLNYCDIDNIIISGWANELHAWNLIKLDDGKWYWCDLTWDDRPDFMWGIAYNYFCVNDTENVGWSEGPFTVAASTFMDSHTPFARKDTGTDFNYDIPARSDTKFDGAEIMLKDTFTVGTVTYAVSGYNSVQLVYTTATDVLNIPATVTYKGETLKVISVGRMDDGRFTVGSIASYLNGPHTKQYTVKKVIIPETVIFIWDDAFNMDALTEISVHKDNEVYTSLNGVLYTKDLSTIIKYPNAKEGREFTLPKETVRIAAGAFTTLYSNTGALILEKIYLGAEGVTAGVRSYGYSYANAKYFLTNGFDAIRSKLSGAKLIYDKSGNVLQAS